MNTNGELLPDAIVSWGSGCARGGEVRPLGELVRGQAGRVSYRGGGLCAEGPGLKRWDGEWVTRVIGLLGWGDLVGEGDECDV